MKILLFIAPIILNLFEGLYEGYKDYGANQKSKIIQGFWFLNWFVILFINAYFQVSYHEVIYFIIGWSLIRAPVLNLVYNFARKMVWNHLGNNYYDRLLKWITGNDKLILALIYVLHFCLYGFFLVYLLIKIYCL